MCHLEVSSGGYVPATLYVYIYTFMNGNNLHTTGGSKVQYIFLPNDSHWATLPERQEAVKQTMTDIFALSKVQAGGGGGVVVFF